MKITALSLTAPVGAESNPRVTPELMASVLAKYSRSNEGLQKILSKVDLANPEASIKRILDFVDYGHASIGGLTGGLAVAIDGVTMFAAYKLFELSPMADGQESSTRYITLDETGLPAWADLGFSATQAEILQKWALSGLRLYRQAYAALDAKAQVNPEIVRIPDKLKDKPKAIERLRKNYALDRARYFLPFAMKTNVAIVQTARMWTETLSGLYATELPELTQLADAIKLELMVYAPHLMRHAKTKPGWLHHSRTEVGPTPAKFTEPDTWLTATRPDSVHVTLFSNIEDTFLAQALAGRQNRYDRCGVYARDAVVRCQWHGMAVAELRDLNRHRTGSRFSFLIPHGFYLPDETRQAFGKEEPLFEWEMNCLKVAAVVADQPALRPYTLSLGAQVDFRHTTQLDKFVQTAETRTGAGAHFRYAKHYGDAVAELAKTYPLTAEAIQLGEAEPE